MAKASERFDTILGQIDAERLFSTSDFYVFMDAYDASSRSNVRNLVARRVQNGVLCRTEGPPRTCRYFKPTKPKGPLPKLHGTPRAGTMGDRFDTFLSEQTPDKDMTLEYIYIMMDVLGDRKGMANVRKLILRRVRAGRLKRDPRAFYGGHKTTFKARFATFHIPAVPRLMKLW